MELVVDANSEDTKLPGFTASYVVFHSGLNLRTRRIGVRELHVSGFPIESLHSTEISEDNYF